MPVYPVECSNIKIRQNGFVSSWALTGHQAWILGVSFQRVKQKENRATHEKHERGKPFNCQVSKDAKIIFFTGLQIYLIFYLLYE
jgi:hypothetical protein